jgi:hypothetical protein
MTDPKLNPSPELVERCQKLLIEHTYEAAIHAAFQAGADQELEACCALLDKFNDSFWCEELRAARRPKPPSLKEQALKELAWVDEHLDMPLHNHCNAIHTIRRALEALPE